MMRGAFAMAWAEEERRSKNEAPKFNIIKVSAIMLRTPSTSRKLDKSFSLTTGIYNVRQ